MTFKEKLAQEHPAFVGDNFRGGAQGCPCHFGYEPYDRRPCAEKIVNCRDCWNREIPEESAIENFERLYTKPFAEGLQAGLAYGKIQDSGERQEFETGAVRDIQKGKGRCDLMPLEVVGKYFKKPIFGLLGMFLKDGNTAHLYECLSLFSSYYGEKTNTVTDCTMFLEVAKHFEEGAEKYGENNWQKGLPAQCYINSAVRHYLKWLRGDKDEPHDRAFVWNLMCCIWEVDYSPRAKEKDQDAKTWRVGNFKFTDRPDRISFVYEPKDENVNAESEPDVWVRLGDCPVGLFVFSDALHAKTSSASPGGIRVIKLNTGDAEWYHPDILVRPLEIDVKELFAGESDE